MAVALSLRVILKVVKYKIKVGTRQTTRCGIKGKGKKPVDKCLYNMIIASLSGAGERLNTFGTFLRAAPV